MRALLLLSCLFACGPKKAPVDPEPDDRLGELQDLYAENMHKAESMQDPETGWLCKSMGDCMLWTGKFCAAGGAVDITAAEWPDKPGRFSRFPPGEPRTNPSNPNWSDWSRDMGVGLLACAWKKQDLSLLERHMSYARRHNWILGEPLGDGRSYYLPGIRARFLTAVAKLGGGKDPARLLPDIFQRGETDYQAHLTTMGIWQRAEFGDIPEDWIDILKENAERDPRDPLFTAMYGRYTGDMAPAFDACLAPDGYAGEYVRCEGEEEECRLAAWLFACKIVLEAYQ